MSEPTQLKGSITLPFLIFYGLGTIVGGGFYALPGLVGAVFVLAFQAWLALGF